MYLHLGHSTVVPYGEIIGIFDLDHVSQSRRTQDFLEKAELEGTLETLGQRIPVSLVITEKKSYLSPISSAMLSRRVGENRWENLPQESK